MLDLLETRLGKRGFHVKTCTTAEDALTQILDGETEVVVTDLQMKALSGIELCERVVQNRPDIPVIVMTGHGTMQFAIDAIRAGAYDFLTKPFEIEQIQLTLERAIQHRRLKEEVHRLREHVAESGHFGELTGSSPVMQKVFTALSRSAQVDTSVLLTGESGTGKGVAARVLHSRSRRAQGPFVVVNCAAMPEALLESELFGHAKGSFTDAKADRRGLFQEADGGILFLDEIGELPFKLQPKLLRAIQEHMVRPVGSDKEVSVDVRIIAATNRDLESAVAERTFREDLYYRINVLRIDLPPLRSRAGDILLYAQAFVVKYAAALGKPVVGISPEAAQKLLSYAWPGNVRELENAIERAIALTSYDRIAVTDLPDPVQAYRRSHVLVAGDDPKELVTLEEVERRYIDRVLEAAGGNKTLAAEILGVDRRTLYRKFGREGKSS